MCIQALRQKAGIGNSCGCDGCREVESLSKTKLEEGDQARNKSGKAWACTWDTALLITRNFYDIKHVLILGAVRRGTEAIF